MAASSLRKLLGLSATDRSLLLRSVILVGAARLLLWALPFNSARRLMAQRARWSPNPYPTPERIGWAISVAKRFIPKGNCLPQALAAESLLANGGYPVELRIGVAKTDDGRLDAHAWVESGGRLVVGDLTQGLASYTPLPPLPAVGR
jgi:hypothetical protein